MKKNFFVDKNGKVTNNDSNVMQMNIFEYWYYLGMPFSIDFKAYFMALGAVLAMPFVIIFYPFVAIYETIEKINRAKRHTKESNKQQAKTISTTKTEE